MLNAFLRLQDGETRTLSTLEDFEPSEGSRIWVDLESPTEEDIRSIGARFCLDADSLDDCLQGEQRPRIDEYDQYIFLVLYGLLGEGKEADPEPRKLAIYCGTNFLITVHREPLRTITRLRGRLTRHAAQILQDGVDSLLYEVIDLVVDNYLLVAQQWEARFEELEEHSLEPDVDESLMQDVSTFRRELIDLRHIAASQLELLTPLCRGECDYVSEGLGQGFSHVKDHLAKVLDSVSGLRELLGGVRDNYSSTLMNRTNDQMKLLTIYATVLLPLSVIAGIYGMNLDLWPPPEQPWSFWGVMAAMGVVAVGSFLLFRWRKWI
jgi:magnesium transporter